MYPELLEIQLTHKCNLQCTYCGNNPQLCQLPDLEKDLALKAIRELEPRKILFTGGEIYLAFKTLLAILDHIDISRYDLILSSNLTMFSIPKLKLLIDHYNFRTFHSSFNDLDELMSDHVRSASSLERENLIKNLEFLTLENCYVKVETILLPYTIKRLKEINSLLYKIGIRHHKIEFLIPLGNADWDMICPYQEIEEAILDLYYNKNNDSIIEMTCFYLTPCSHKVDSLFELSEKNGDFIYNQCIDGYKTCYLLANGQLLPCFLFPDNIYDMNIANHNAFDLWSEHELFKNFRLDNNDCNQCEYYTRKSNNSSKCNNGCVVLNYITSGQFGSKSIIPK